jgi:predicted small secreted protein
MIRKAILVLTLAGMLFAAMGCNTVRGFGEDLSRLGHWLTESASN